MRYTKLLTDLGLTSKEALVWEALLSGGKTNVPTLVKRTKLQRGTIHFVLKGLIAKGFVEKKGNGKATWFMPNHPQQLYSLLEEKEKILSQSRQTITAVIPTMIGEYNLALNKPGIRFYEGEEGVRQITEDSLTSKTEIYSYIDNEAVNKYIPKINIDYVKRRQKLQIKKRMITVDSKYIRERGQFFNPKITDVRVISGKYPFSTVMQIYDNKVSYLTLDENKMIGIIIEDPHIYKMHKTLFEYTWETAKSLPALRQEVPTP